METRISPRSRILKRTFRFNMIVGLLITAIATYFIITGHYDNIQAREAAETLMGWIAVGGLLYVAAFWYMCLFREQLFLKTKAE